LSSSHTSSTSGSFTPRIRPRRSPCLAPTRRSRSSTNSALALALSRVNPV